MICKKCGADIADNATFCNYCGQPVAENAAAPEVIETPAAQEAPQLQPQKPENVIAGIIGAIFGALIGGASIVLLSQLGYIASISGFLIAFLALKGYEWLGGRLTTKGIVLSIVLCLIVPMLSYMMSIAIAVMQELPGVGLGEAFGWVVEALLEGAIWSDITSDVLMLYGFTALGAYSTISAAFKKNKK